MINNFLSIKRITPDREEGGKRSLIVRRGCLETQENLILPAEITKDDDEEKVKPDDLEGFVHNHKSGVYFCNQLNGPFHRTAHCHTRILLGVIPDL